MERANFTWDVFISYRRVSPDEDWVQKQLVPKLDDTGLKVWLDVRDSTAGHDLYKEIEETIQKSRRAICIISPSYLKETQKGDGLVAFEYRKLRESNQSGTGLRLIPLLLAGARVPEGISWLINIKWTNPDAHDLEWKRLLNALEAVNLNVRPPGPVNVYPVKRHFRRAVSIACLILLLAGMIALGRRLTSSESAARQDRRPSPAPTLQLDTETPPPTPTPTPYRDTSSLPRATIRTFGGKVAKRDMPVPPSAVVAGVVEGEIVPGSRVFVYVQRKGGDYDNLWHCAGTVLPDGRAWSLEGVEFRLPEFERETKATVLTLLRAQQECRDFNDPALSEIVESSAGAPSWWNVTVSRPEVRVGNARLDRTQSFTASGTASNLLDGEELCVNLKVTRGTQEVISRCFHTTVSGRSWLVSERIGIEARAGDTYTVEVSLAPKGSTDDYRPEGFRVLDRRVGVL